MFASVSNAKLNEISILIKCIRRKETAKILFRLMMSYLLKKRYLNVIFLVWNLKKRLTLLNINQIPKVKMYPIMYENLRFKLLGVLRSSFLYESLTEQEVHLKCNQTHYKHPCLSLGRSRHAGNLQEEAKYSNICS